MQASELVFPANYPMGLVRMRAIAHLNAEAQRKIRREATPLYALSALLATALVLSVWPLIGLTTGNAWVLAQLALAAGSAAIALEAYRRRQRLLSDGEKSIIEVQNRILCPLQVLNARFHSHQTATPEAALLNSFQRAAAGLTASGRHRALVS